MNIVPPWHDMIWVPWSRHYYYDNIIVYDLYNIDYKYIGELFGKNISNEIKNRRGNHVNTKKWQLDEYIYDKPNIEYRYRKVAVKYFYNDDIQRKVYDFYEQDFIYFKKFGFDYKM